MRPTQTTPRLFAAALCLGMLLGGCRGKEELPGAATEPAAAVRQLVQHLHDDDLVGYARAAVPPEQYVQLEQAWAEGHSRWPLTQLPLDERLAPLLATLSAPDAEKDLQRAFRAQIAGQAAGVRQAAQSLGLFGVQYLSNKPDYSPAQREHYVQLVQALSEWAMVAPLTDPQLARGSIERLARAAREAGVASDEDLGRLGMTAGLERLGPFLRALKQTLAAYGLSLDDTAAGVRVGLVEQNGDQATVRVQYPLGARELDIEVALQRRDRHWYVARTLQKVDEVLQVAAQARAREAAAALPPTPQDDPGAPAKP